MLLAAYVASCAACLSLCPRPAVGDLGSGAGDAEPSARTLHAHGMALQRAGKYQEAAAAYSAASTKMLSGAAVALFNLGNAHNLLQAPSEAAAAYQKAIATNPAMVGPHLNLGILRMGQHRHDEAGRQLKAAAALDPSNLQVLSSMARFRAVQSRWDESVAWMRPVFRAEKENFETSMSFGLFLAKAGQREKASKLFRLMIQRLVSSGEPAITFALNIKGGAPRFESENRKEAAAFAKTLAGQERIAGSYTGALGRVRKLENEEEWLVSYVLESADVFGVATEETHNSAYGIVWYHRWAEVLGRPVLGDLFRPGAHAVVLGSGLGYHCLFFAAHGLDCTGYDLICDNMVSVSEEIIGGLPGAPTMSFKCASAEAADMHGAAVVWVNDKQWSEKLRGSVFDRAAAELPHDSVIISFQPVGGKRKKLFVEVDTATLGTSWDPVQPLYLYRRAGRGEAPRAEGEL